MRLPPLLLAPLVAFALAVAPGRAAVRTPAFDAGAWADSALAGVYGPADSARASAAPAPARDYVAEARAAFGAENRAYQRVRVTLRIVTPLAGALAWLLLVFSGSSARFRDIAERVSRRLWVQAMIAFGLCGLAWAVLMLPLSLYSGWSLERQFGLATQTWPAWLFDHGKALAATFVAIAVTPVLALAVRAMRRSPRRWWAWLAAGTLPVIAASTLLSPLVFEPLFNDFVPLRDASLRRDIVALAERAGVPGRDVLEADMSRQTKRLNAYVSGIGRTQRIVLWDTTIEAMSRDEILFVLAHEMGHYRLAHLWKGLLLVSLGAFALFGLASRVVVWALARWGAEWGIAGPGDLAALPLHAAVLALLLYVAAPIENGVSRAMEHEADAYAIDLTHDGDAGARAFLALAAANRSDPEPPTWLRLWLWTHPPLADRIRFVTGSGGTASPGVRPTARVVGR